MKVCYVGAYYDPGIVTGHDFVDHIYTVREFAREQARLGAEVYVLQHFHRDETFVRDGVSYRFVRPWAPYRLISALLTRLRPSTPPAHFQPATRLVTELKCIQPDVVHFFGITLDLNLRLVARAVEQLRIPLVVQFNGGRPPRNRLRRVIQRGNIRRVDRFLFTTTEHARPWTESRMRMSSDRVVPLMETSSIFAPVSRSDARIETGMTGDPVFLWTGRLHPEKDPITAVRGFERVQKRWPDAHFYLYYLTDELLPDLKAYVRGKSFLKGHVHFCGRAPYERMPAIYNSADFFVQASSREASGCAVLEAMSCGVIPIVTDIPSFRAMTDGGRIGRLFPLGDAVELARCVHSYDLQEIPRQSADVRCHFERHLSFPALARTLNHLYRHLTENGSERIT